MVVAVIVTVDAEVSLSTKFSDSYSPGIGVGVILAAQNQKYASSFVWLCDESIMLNGFWGYLFFHKTSNTNISDLVENQIINYTRLLYFSDQL